MKRLIYIVLFSALLFFVFANNMFVKQNPKDISLLLENQEYITNYALQLDKKINHYIAEEQQLWHEVSVIKANDEPNFTDIVAQSVKSVVHVRCPNWQGSGFVIDEHIICTARHVVEGVEDFEITFNDGKKIKAVRAISDKEHDVGFIWVEEDMNDIAKIGSIKECKLGQDVFIVGSPYGDINFNSVSKGIISGLNRNWDEINWQTGEPYGWKIAFTSDSAAHPGNSGGAVFTTDGVVRGILVGSYSPVLNCSMPCDLFLSDIENIKLMFTMDRFEIESATSRDK